MRRYGDISIQYRYGGSRYVSWPSAIYRDTTLTFVIRGCHHVVSIFLYLTIFRICLRNIISVGVVCIKCLLKWTLSGLFFIYSGKRWSKVTVLKTMFLTFKLPQSSQTFFCLAIFYFAICSQIPKISNLTLYCILFTIYCIVIYIVRNNYIS